MDLIALKLLLDQKHDAFNLKAFIPHDPICIPHRFTHLQDIEISGLFAATFAWGQRQTIINKANELMSRMDNMPYDFVKNHTQSDLKRLLHFKHRTFNDTDLLHFIGFLHVYYQKNNSLENIFFDEMNLFLGIENGLKRLHTLFFDDEFAPQRTKKHLSTPANGSACKRLCMYLRWLVRNDDRGVDFGLWQKIPASSLIIPLDVHVLRTAKTLGILNIQDKANWNTALKLTHFLAQLDPKDPTKYDFALFGMGIQKNLSGQEIIYQTK